jgi:hypothetical protein
VRRNPFAPLILFDDRLFVESCFGHETTMRPCRIFGKRGSPDAYDINHGVLNWTSSASSIASVSKTGLATTTSPGTARKRARGRVLVLTVR